MIVKLDDRFQKRLQGRFGKYDFQVGVLEDGPHKEPLSTLRATGKRARKGERQLTTYAGGPARKKSRVSGPLTIAQVSEANRARLGFNYLKRPFQERTSDIIKFTTEFFRLAFGRSQKRRAENLLQAVVRNPILRGDYGSNTRQTIRAKGFDRLMIDTAQLFKAIKARCTVRSSNV